MAKARRKAVTAQSVQIQLNKLIAVLDAWTQPKGDGVGDDAYIQAQAAHVNKLIKQLRAELKGD